MLLAHSADLIAADAASAPAPAAVEARGGDVLRRRSLHLGICRTRGVEGAEMAGGSLGDGRGEWWRLVGGDGSGDGVVSGGGKMGALGAMAAVARRLSGCLEPDHGP